MLSKITVLLCFYLALAVSKPAEDSKNGLKDARAVFSSQTSPCIADSDSLLLTVQTTSLYQSTNCSASAFTKAVEEIYIYSAEYVSQAMAVVTKIGFHFTGCAAELVPFNVIVCVINGIMELPAEIGTLIDVSFQYFDNILMLIPPLLSDIESCFSNSTENYEMELRDLFHRTKVC